MTEIDAIFETMEFDRKMAGDPMRYFGDILETIGYTPLVRDRGFDMEKQRRTVAGHPDNRSGNCRRLLRVGALLLGVMVSLGSDPLAAQAEPAGDTRMDVLQATLAGQNEEVRRLEGRVREQEVKLAAQEQELKRLNADGIPVGAVIPFFLAPSEIRKLAPFWLPADGRMVNDRESPFNGRNLPDISERMILGKSANLDVTVADTIMEGGSQILNLSLRYSGNTTGAQFPWGTGGRIPAVFEPEFTIDTAVDELKHANHRHDYSGTMTTQVTIPLPPYRGLVYMVRVR